MAEKDKQLRSRATPDQHEHLTNAAGDAGLNLSEYIRSVLLDNHVLIVGDGEHGDLFRLIPAFSSVEAERDAAVANLEGLLALGEQLKAAQAQAAPSSPEPALQPDSQVPPASPVAPVENPPAPAPEAESVVPVQAPMGGAAVPPAVAPPMAPVAAAEATPYTGPIPAADENFDAFMERRVGELMLTGLSSMRASLESEAEWRSYQDREATAINAAPALAAVPAPTTATPVASFCSHCGTPLGGPYCANCGQPAV